MNTSVKIGEKTIEAVQGDITECNLDAIVNAANNHFWMGGGVAGAIKRKGGIEIEREAMAHGPKPVGEAVLTKGGTLKSRHVIHAAVMGQDLSTGKDKIRRATRAALALAESSGIRSIAFPALGTGVGRFPCADAAKIMVEETVDFLRHSKTLATVRYVLFDDEAYRAYSTELNKLHN